MVGNGLGTQSFSTLAGGYDGYDGYDAAEATEAHNDSETYHAFMFEEDTDNVTKYDEVTSVGAQFERLSPPLDAPNLILPNNVNDHEDAAHFSDSGYSSGHYPTTVAETRFDAKDESEDDRAPTTDLSDDNGSQSKSNEIISHDDRSSIESVASDMDDIQSRIETRRTQQVLEGEEELQRLFIQNDTILLVAQRILERTDRSRFLRYARRLLKGYYKELRLCARSTLETLAVELLRSRYARLRLAQALLDKIDPSDEAQNQSFLDRSQDTIKNVRLEAWLAERSGTQDDSPQIDDWSPTPVEEYSESSDDETELPEPQNLVHIAKLQSFFGETPAFDHLLLEMALLVCPGPLKTIARTIMAIPSENITTKCNAVEQYFELCRSWFRSMSHLGSESSTLSTSQGDAARKQIRWRCYCNRSFTAKVNKEHWPFLVGLLEIKGNKCYGQHQCNQTFLPLNCKQRLGVDVSQAAGLRNKIVSNPAGNSSPRSSNASSATSHQSNTVGSGVVPQAASPNPSLSSRSNSGRSSTTGATSISSTSISVTGSDLIVLFGAKGGNPYVQIESIDTKQHNDDSKFFSRARNDYLNMRGFLRYWFSIWQFDHCDFVKFSKQLPSIVNRTNVSLPTSLEYHYSPRPPDATPQTQIDLHIWSVLFSKPCSETLLSKIFGICVLSWLHEWIHVCTPALKAGRVDLLSRIPRKTSPWLIDQHGVDEAWGIQAIDMPIPSYLFLYYLLILAGPTSYWIQWYSVYNDVGGNPPDLQNPSVPLLVVLSVLVAPLAVWQAMMSGPNVTMKHD